MAVSKIDLQNVNVKNGSTWYKLCPFPVGFVYLSSTNTSPANTYGGTWAQLNDDRYLRCGTWSAAGSNSASHTHGLSNGYACITTNLDVVRYREKKNISWTSTYCLDTGGANIGQADNKTMPDGTMLGGNSNPTTVTITPSYREVYCWYRTA